MRRVKGSSLPRRLKKTPPQEHGLPVRRACQVVRLSRVAYYRPRLPRLIRDTDVVTALNEVVARHARWGFWKCFHRLRRAGHRWSHKRVHRVYCALRLTLPRRTKRRVPARLRQPLIAPTDEQKRIPQLSDRLAKQVPGLNRRRRRCSCRCKSGCML